MKKLVLFSAVIVAVAFSSCKKTTEAPAVEEPATVEVITVEEPVVEEDTTVVIEAETIEVAE